LHNGNNYASLPVGHSLNLKESYENLELVLTKIGYIAYDWNLVKNFKNVFNNCKNAGLCYLPFGTGSYWGHVVAQLVEALSYKPEGRGIDSRWCQNFSLT
jgi:hypothetical protein